MTGIDLHFRSDVGTTYKRALKTFHDFRDGIVAGCFTVVALIEAITKSLLIDIMQVETCDAQTP
jgi:hypothetical protein